VGIVENKCLILMEERGRALEHCNKQVVDSINQSINEYDVNRLALHSDLNPSKL